MLKNCDFIDFWHISGAARLCPHFYLADQDTCLTKLDLQLIQLRVRVFHNSNNAIKLPLGYFQIEYFFRGINENI